MQKLTKVAVSSLVVLAAVVTVPTGAVANCVPSLASDIAGSTCIGTGALANNVNIGGNPGSNNTAVGKDALYSNTTGFNNTASGLSALFSNTTGDHNTATGSQSLYSNTTGSFNTATGINALFSNTTGDHNTATGVGALTANTTGTNNTASGASPLTYNTTGSNNTATGVLALFNNITGSNNTAIGLSALETNTTGSNNIALGFGAGYYITTGGNNIAIGNVGVATDANTIRIGTNQTATFIAGIQNTRITRGKSVQINANGQLGVTRSSIRYKEDVHSMGDVSNALMELRPVTFRYKEAETDGSKPIQYGLIAEEVEKVMPALVIYNDNGTPESVAYEMLPSLLLNEYQKQNRKLAATEVRLDTVEAELAVLKLAVSRLAGAPNSVDVATSAP